MPNNTTPIFGRLRNVTKEDPYVTGAVDIKDDVKNKDQQTINQETDEHLGEHDIYLETHDAEIADRYTKEEVDNIVSRTPETDVIVIEVPAASQSDIAGWLDANTPSGTDPETGRSVRANKLYRVPGPDNTTYSEWAWDGTAYIMLANKDYGIDENVEEDSDNFVKGGGIYNFVRQVLDVLPSGIIPFSITDKFNNPILYLDNDKIMHFIFKVVADLIDVDELTVNEINGAIKILNYDSDSILFAVVDKYDNIIIEIDKQCNIVNNETEEKVLSIYSIDYKTINFAIVDKYDNIILAITCSNKIIPANSVVQEQYQSDKSDCYLRNKDKEGILFADSAYNNISSSSIGHHDSIINKRLQLIVATDTHTLYKSFENAIDATKDFRSVDALIHLGDFGYVLDPASDTYPKNKPVIDKATKPLFMTPGNHDVGNASSYILYTKSDIVLYNRWIKPSVDKGYLRQGEYQEGKCYYYHDFESYHVRLIMLYPYDDGSEIDSTYWRTIPYDLSYDNISVRTYDEGDRINIPGFTEYSFEAKETIEITTVASREGVAGETINGVYVDYGYDKVPRYKTVKWYSWYSQEQLDWLVSKLEEAQDLGFAVIIAQHYPCIYGGGTTAAQGVHVLNTRFNNPYRINSIEFEPRYADEDKNIIAQIANCYVNGGHIDKTVYPYGEINPANRKSSHYTHQGVYYDQSGLDDASNLSEVTLDYTFEGGGKVFFINGHNHSDHVVKANSYNIIQLGFLSGTVYGVPNCDMPRTEEDDDTSTAITIDKENNNIHLSRLGVDKTVRVDEDMKIIKKDNEVINF